MKKKSKYGRMFVQASAEPNSFELCRAQPKMRGRNPKLDPKTHCVLYKLEQHTIELVKLSRQIVELSRELKVHSSFFIHYKKQNIWQQ
ncbi:hypothetical protein [Bacteroides caccae]|uniref:hypothetical protein n=1 Tax=Bacteroides caccae TaxID=47678 RepID=UPI0032EDCC2F